MIDVFHCICLFHIRAVSVVQPFVLALRLAAWSGERGASTGGSLATLNTNSKPHTSRFLTNLDCLAAPHLSYENSTCRGDAMQSDDDLDWLEWLPSLDHTVSQDTAAEMVGATEADELRSGAGHVDGVAPPAVPELLDLDIGESPLDFGLWGDFETSWTALCSAEPPSTPSLAALPPVEPRPHRAEQVSTTAYSHDRGGDDFTCLPPGSCLVLCRFDRARLSTGRLGASLVPRRLG